jgi:hypothetical protein
MIDLYKDHCEVVKEALSGGRTIDEQTYASMAALNERLQRVKKMGPKFAIVEFSPAVRKLKNNSNKVVAV